MRCNFAAEPRRKYLDRWDSCDVQAAPGSGKTTLLVAKLVHLAAHWPFTHQGVCVLSHTNVAREEIEQRVGAIPQASRLLRFPNFFGTLTQFCHRFLALPLLDGMAWPLTSVDDAIFSARILSYAQSKPMLRRRLWMQATKEQTARWLAALTLSDDFVISDGPPTRIKIAAPKKMPGPHTPTGVEIEELKGQLIARGIYRYEDMTVLAQRALLLAPGIGVRLAGRFPLVILDEAQDTPGAHLDLIDSVFGGGRAALQRIGDCNQAILGGDGPDGRVWKPAASHIDLGESMRFGSKIARFASRITCHHPQTIASCGIAASAHDHPPHLMLVTPGSEAVVGKHFAELVASKLTDAKPLDLWAVGWIRKESPAKDARRLGNYFKSYEASERSKQPGETLLGVLRDELALSGSHPFDMKALVGLYAEQIRLVLGEYVAWQELAPARRIWRWLDHARPGSAREARSILLNIVGLRGKVSRADWDELQARLRLALEPRLPRTARAQAIEKRLAYTESTTSDSAEARHDARSETHEIGGRTIRIQIGTIASVKGRTHDATLVVQTTWGPIKDITYALETVASGIPTTKPTALRAVMNVFVAATRPRHLLCLALPADDRIEKLRPALEAQGIVIMEVS